MLQFVYRLLSCLHRHCGHGAEVEILEHSERNVDRQTPASESVSVPAPRERMPTPVATRPADVSRVEPTSTMVLRSHTPEGRTSAEIPEMHARPEVVRQLEVEIPAEMEISARTSVRRRFGTARPNSDADPVAEMAQKDKPEIVPAF